MAIVTKVIALCLFVLCFCSLNAFAIREIFVTSGDKNIECEIDEVFYKDKCIPAFIEFSEINQIETDKKIIIECNNDILSISTED